MVDLNPDKKFEQLSAPPEALPESECGGDPASHPSNKGDRGASLIRALRVILSSAERTIGHPFGKNEQLAASLRRLHALLGKLPQMTDSAFIEAIEAIANEKPRRDTAKRGNGESRPLRDLSLDEIERLISDPEITKQRLLAIVRERFGGATGSLSKMRHEALLETVAAMAMNERSHQTIARLASRDANLHPSQRTNAAPETKTGPHGEQPQAGNNG